MLLIFREKSDIVSSISFNFASYVLTTTSPYPLLLLLLLFSCFSLFRSPLFLLVFRVCLLCHFSILPLRSFLLLLLLLYYVFHSSPSSRLLHHLLFSSLFLSSFSL